MNRLSCAAVRLSLSPNSIAIALSVFPHAKRHRSRSPEGRDT
jgi:hypothetical protein